MCGSNVYWSGTRCRCEESLDLGYQSWILIADDVGLWDGRNIGRDEVDWSGKGTVGLGLVKWEDSNQNLIEI